MCAPSFLQGVVVIAGAVLLFAHVVYGKLAARVRPPPGSSAAATQKGACVCVRAAVLFGLFW
jgi:hypothetical protein